MIYRFLKSSWVIFLLLFLCVVAYINILPNKLFFDDEELIYKNRYVQNLIYLPNYFTENMIAGAEKFSNMYRPILLLSFAIDWRIWKSNPIGYHITSITLHYFNSVLIFYLVSKLYSRKIALFTSILFTIHPAISEAVIYASGRTDPLYSLFALLAVISWDRFLTYKKIYLYFFSVFFFLTSLLSKEAGIVVPILLLLILFKKYNLSLNKKTAYLISLLFPFLTLCFIYITLRLTVFNFINILNFYSFNTEYSSLLLVRIYTFSKVFFDYILLLIFPSNLLVAYAPRIINSFLNIWVLLFLSVLAVSIFIFIKEKNKSASFSIAWFFLSLIPASGAIPINNIMAEHYLYLPSVGFCLFISICIVKLLSQKNLFVRLLIFFLFSAYSVLLLVRINLRIYDWRNPITFYTKALIQSPGHIPMLNNLAMSYDEVGEKSKAKEIYLKIINTRDIYPNVHHNLGVLYQEEGSLSLAEKEYYKALSIDPNFIFSKNALLNLKSE